MLWVCKAGNVTILVFRISCFRGNDLEFGIAMGIVTRYDWRSLGRAKAMKSMFTRVVSYCSIAYISDAARALMQLTKKTGV